MTDSPTPLGMAVDPADSRINPDADRTNECGLSKVGAETRPEVVVDRITARVDRARVNGRPMAKEVEVRDQQRETGQDEEDKYAEPKPLYRTPRCVERVESRITVARSSLRLRGGALLVRIC